MFFPTINELNSSRSMTDTFLGYNHKERIGEGEFYDMQNLSSSSFPLLSPRCKRGTYLYPLDGTDSSQEGHNPQGIIAKDALCYVDNGKFYINNHSIDLNLDNSPKQLVSMGAYVVIFPDKVWVNTDNKEHGKIDAIFDSNPGSDEGSNIDISLCALDGTDYEINSETPSETAPEVDSNGNIPLWIDTSSKPHSLKKYSESQGMWVSVPTCYVKIACPNIGAPFEVGDGITISGLIGDGSPKAEKDLADLNSTMILQGKDENNGWIIVIGMIDGTYTQEAANKLTVVRQSPAMDFVVESNNRLWGCRYGLANNGQVVNEIYASKLGDFKNWNCFEGIATDSYAASVGTDGQWTGAISYLGYPLFFKENHLHKVYGNYPANYQIQSTACSGVQKGSHRSLAIANEVLYYKSRNGICAYQGSLPSEITEMFGGIQYYDAVAGANRGKYYISMKDAGDIYYLFAYDTTKGLWHKEDNLKADAFCSCDGEMYCIVGGEIKTLLGSGMQDADNVEWYAVSGIMGTESPDRKYISRLNIRLALAPDSKLDFYAEYNSSGTWEHLSEIRGRGTLRTVSFPIRPKRCDHFRLKISGIGDAKIFSITKTIEQGSDGR